MSKAHRSKLISDEKHLSGAFIHWSEREAGVPRKVAFTCRGCHEKSFAWYSTVRSKNWLGLCQSCGRKHKRSSPRKFSNEEEHASGAFIHWSEREPEELSKIA